MPFESSGWQKECSCLRNSVLSHKYSGLRHLFDVFHVFHVPYILHVLQTYFMFSNPGLQDSTNPEYRYEYEICITSIHTTQRKKIASAMARRRLSGGITLWVGESAFRWEPRWLGSSAQETQKISWILRLVSQSFMIFFKFFLGKRF